MIGKTGWYIKNNRVYYTNGKKDIKTKIYFSKKIAENELKRRLKSEKEKKA